ncbi:MAG: class I SAM-dependent methyltransferase [Ignavibacteriales bacterium]|nr:class I SAM-dependent methyltransferase [Ignavibacteriales bacterium]
MSNCCSHPSAAESTGKFFSKRSKSYARGFRKGKLEKVQQYLIDEIIKEPMEGKTLLDIGSGVGKLHLTLLQHGAASAVGIDMSEEMLNHAKAFAQKFGLDRKVSYKQGDFMSISEPIDSADITMLDKVICCYENLDGLITASANRTKFLYALTFPSNNFLTKTIFKTEILVSKVFRSGFRPYWHDWNRVTNLLTHLGFEPKYSRSTLLWQAMVFTRNT